MAHADVCPCKHLRFVCRGACPNCMVALYGPAGASEILRRDGEAPQCPPGYDIWQDDHREADRVT